MLQALQQSSIVVVSGIMVEEFQAFRSIEQNDQTRPNAKRSNIKKKKREERRKKKEKYFKLVNSLPIFSILL